jgi:uroporphyrinogen III methyltransferase/synthase
MAKIKRKCKGFVWLVGAGPGDASLLTLRAKECLKRADVVIYDRLVAPSILSFARPDAELIYAGKEPNGEKTSQAWINETMIAKAREGKKVVRLKNGDPFVFGRGRRRLRLWLTLASLLKSCPAFHQPSLFPPMLASL